VTLADTEETWDEVFETQVGATYTSPALVLFKDATQSPYGGATAQSGLFYCPGDNKAYLPRSLRRWMSVWVQAVISPRPTWLPMTSRITCKNNWAFGGKRTVCVHRSANAKAT
jgi:hypothetical protein